jgi:hypothetical protein
MKYIKTFKKFVAGSEKYFDVFECIVEEVDEYLDSSGRKGIKIRVGEQEFKGLHNKKVFEYLVENEGSESFIILWKSGKGNYLLSYAWELWKAYSEKDNQYDTIREEKKEANNEAFVYLWINRYTDQKYLGNHKGKPEDGYIASGELFLKEYRENPELWHRTILAYGSKEEMYELETILLIQLGAATSDKWLNLQNNLRDKKRFPHNES